MTDQTDAVEIVPFELLTQKEQWSHLQRFHLELWGSLPKASKTPKAEMEDWHRKAHLEGRNQRQEHTHTAIVKKDDGTSPSAKEMMRGGILNASQRKALKDLVENDFLALKAEINQFADDMAKQKRDEINAEWASKGADKTDFYARGRELMAEYRNGVDKLIMDARSKGVELTMPSFYGREIEAKVPGLQQAIKLAELDVESDRRRALNSLERARLTAQRKVLMTGVNEDALQILETIPNAKQLMIQAATERVNPQAVTAQ